MGYAWDLVFLPLFPAAAAAGAVSGTAVLSLLSVLNAPDDNGRKHAKHQQSNEN